MFATGPEPKSTAKRPGFEPFAEPGRVLIIGTRQGPDAERFEPLQFEGQRAAPIEKPERTASSSDTWRVACRSLTLTSSKRARPGKNRSANLHREFIPLAQFQRSGLAFRRQTEMRAEQENDLRISGERHGQ